MKEFLYKKVCANCGTINRYSFGIGISLRDKIKVKCTTSDCGLKALPQETKEINVDTIKKEI